MSKKNKIIVSIVGITIVLLALLGITYAYYLTRIEGNTNTNSISVTTAKLELVYSDNKEEIITSSDALMPDSNNPIGTKTFTVTNNGNDSSYVVIIDNVSIKKVSDNTDTNFLSNDFRYTLTCTVKDKSGNVLDGETCNKVSNLDIFPIKGGILVSNNIPQDKVHEYTLTLWYIDTGVDQSDDMGKSYQARVNIKDMTSVNPFSTGVSETDNKSLVYNILNNAKTNKNGTQFVNVPLTTPAESSSAQKYVKANDPTSFTASRSSATNYYITYSDDYTINETDGKFTLINKDGSTPTTIKYSGTSLAETLKGKYAYWSTDEFTAKNVTNIYHIYKMSTNLGDFTSSSIKYENVSKGQASAENILTVTSDDYGTSYYFRGGVTDNYVNFAGMCWRIVRIEGDGSVKLILEDRYEQCNDKEGQDLNNNGTYFTGNWSGGEEDYYVFGNYNNRADFYNYTESVGLQYSLKTFQTENLTSTDLEKLKVDEWCYDDKVTSTYTYECDKDWDGEYESLCTEEHYGAHTRIYTNEKPSLNCSGTKLTKYKDGTNMYVGTLTADEMSFAGADSNYLENYNYYLMNSYAKDNYLNWWSLSPSYFDGEYSEGSSFILEVTGSLISFNRSDGGYSRPAVSLKSGSVISEGEGTLEKPYIIV